ncbi:Nuclear pore complex protein NUP88 [Rhynchospora pubera]|uniref:Nuclear pore complex protein NUP88 n=1 Tax=Rhynchospora pubera TaxID=906938 RepID=A0AAV8D494_9POAL|nr:Nuclear pore complex protein NUP88 [Rhynchospora pubera]
MTRLTAPPSPPPSPPLSSPTASTSTSTSLVPSSSLPLSNAKRSKRSFIEWVPLATHPVFASLRDSHPGLEFNPGSGGGRLVAWDAVVSRLYLWDPSIRGIHSLSVRLQDSQDGSEPWDLVSVEAAVPSEILVPSVQITHEVHQISVNRDGSALLIAGSDKLTVISIFDKTSTNGETVICRALPVATQILLGQDKGIRVLQASWHPSSRAHFGLLTSDAIFRLFDLSSNLERPEQEFYLQQVPSGRGLSAVSLCPVAFSYGGHYLWDTFSIFFLFSDGSIYILCPVVPFGSLYTQKRIKEIYDDVRSFESEASNTNAIRPSRLALSWLEETFPEMLSEVLDVHGLSLCRACAYAPLDASLVLQGPLCKISHDQGADDLKGRAISFLCTSAGKDSILITAVDTSLLYIQALADEIHPQWATDAGPRLSLDANHKIKGVAMICESSPQNTDGPGKTPPLIELAVVDLELSYLDQKQQGAVLSLFPDPVVGERFYCVHSGGADAVTLNFLPSSDVDVELTSTKPPSVQPIFKIGNKGLYGFVTIVDSFGGSHIIGVTHKYECIVIEMKRWKETVTLNWGEIGEAGSVDMTSEVMTGVSKDLLAGPKPVVFNSTGSLKTMNPESIEGRSTFHHYMKIFRENYVEYAHKVSIEVKERTRHLESLIEEQNKRVNAVKKLLETVETKEDRIQERIECACSSHDDLERRLNKLRSLPLVHKKPLSKAEKDFRGQLDRFVGVELDALHSAIEALSARMKRYNSSHASSVSPRRTALKSRTHASEAQVSLLKSSLGKLSSINEENTQKLKLLEQHFASLEM